MADVRLNTLYITQDGLYLHIEGETIEVKRKDDTLLRVPLHHLQSICLLTHANLSPYLLERCLLRSISITYLSPRGRFLGRLEGFGQGNVLLRKMHFERHGQVDFGLQLSRVLVAGKIQNLRLNLLRYGRDQKNMEASERLRGAAEKLGQALDSLQGATALNELRGAEGSASRTYFAVLNDCVTIPGDEFQFDGRTRRPPRSRINALLSFLYSLWTNDCMSALQAVGLDPFVGFLHVLRSGRPALALDLVEEFRAMADRMAITLINRRQIRPSDFQIRIGGAINFTSEGRKTILKYFQERKQDELLHPFLEQKTRIADLPLLQARLLARHIRGELDVYPPFLWK